MEAAVLDQLNRQVAVLSLAPDAEKADVIYCWRPTEALGFHAAERYFYPSDARLRVDPRTGKQVFLTCASHGFCAMISYQDGTCLWQETLEKRLNPHAIELLPNGSIAVACSTGGVLRVYSPRGASGYTECCFPDAHGLLWDEKRKVLWAVGQERLAAFRVEDAGEAVHLREAPELAATIPSANGHDIWPDMGDKDAFWIVAAETYRYSVRERRFSQDFAGRALLPHGMIKSLFNQPGEITWACTTPNGRYEIWNTDEIKVLFEGRRQMTTVKLDHMAIYRVRPWRIPS